MAIYSGIVSRQSKVYHTPKMSSTAASSGGLTHFPFLFSSSSVLSLLDLLEDLVPRAVVHAVVEVKDLLQAERKEEKGVQLTWLPAKFFEICMERKETPGKELRTLWIEIGLSPLKDRKTRLEQ